MKRIRNIIAISAFSMLVLALPGIASAQWGGNNGGYGYPNGGYNQGQYYGNMEQVADRLKDRSRDFERQIDREFNYNRNRSGNYGGGGILGTILGGGTYGNRGYGNDQIKRMAEDFRRAANEFENRVDNDDFGRRSGRVDARAQQSAERMLNLASQIDRFMATNGRGSAAMYQWNAIRSDLNLVANAYGRGGYNNRNNRNNRFPF